MQIQFNTDRSIEGNEKLAEEVEAIVSKGLDRFSGKITRLEIHLSDENSDKKSGAKDKRCLLEARLAGLKPASVAIRRRRWRRLSRALSTS